MFTTSIKFKNFKFKKKNIVEKKLKILLSEKNHVLSSLSKKYKDRDN